MSSRRVVSLVGVVLLAVVVLFAYQLFISPRDYAYRIEYSILPQDDVQLANWLRSQPGVSASSVSREGSTVIVTFTHTRGKPFPYVPVECERCGYHGIRSFWGGLVGTW